MPGGGGGGGYSPQILVGMCRVKVENGQGLRNELPVERENAGLRNELENVGLRNELENVGLRNELDPFLSVNLPVSGNCRDALDPFWAWKCQSPELPGRVWLTRGAAERFALAVGGDERVEIKEILKMMVSGTTKSAKKCKIVMLRNGFFCVEICENDMLRNGNSGLKMGVSRGTYPICMEVPPPPPGGVLCLRALGPSLFPFLVYTLLTTNHFVYW